MTQGPSEVVIFEGLWLPWMFSNLNLIGIICSTVGGMTGGVCPLIFNRDASDYCIAALWFNTSFRSIGSPFKMSETQCANMKMWGHYAHIRVQVANTSHLWFWHSDIKLYLDMRSKLVAQVMKILCGVSIHLNLPITSWSHWSQSSDLLSLIL